MTIIRFEDMSDLVRSRGKKTEQCTHCAVADIICDQSPPIPCMCIKPRIQFLLCHEHILFNGELYFARKAE